MNEDRLVIPHDILLYVPKKLTSVAFIAGISDKKSSYLTGRRNFHYGTVGKGCSDDDFLTYSIPNTGIELWLSEEDNFSGFTSVGSNGYYGGNVWIGLRSPELQSIFGERSINVPIPRDLLWSNIILKYKSIRQGGRLPGHYALVPDRFGTVTPVLEKRVSKTQELAKKAGELAQKKMTSFWTPGHLYLLKNKSYILYLGELDNVCTVQSWNTYERTRSIKNYASLTTTSAYKIDKGRLFVYIRDLSDLPKKMPILDFLRDEVIKNGNYTLYFRDWCAPWTGADISEVLEEDKDSGSKIKAWADGVISSMRGFTNITDEQNYALSMSPGSVQNHPRLLERYKDLKVGLIKDAISDAAKSHYARAPKTVDELWNDLQGGGYWCGSRSGGDLVKGIFWDATEDEIKNELKKCF